MQNAAFSSSCIWALSLKFIRTLPGHSPPIQISTYVLLPIAKISTYVLLPIAKISTYVLLPRAKISIYVCYLHMVQY